MNILVKIIENDDLESFKNNFQLENWKDTITKIENYANVDTPEFIKNDPHYEVSYDNTDVLKYAVHCNATKIFNYLLPLTDTDKHSNYEGWPILSMALKNRNYDFAHQIINHPTFNPYAIYHYGCFAHIETRPDIEQHIDFLFKYLEKIPTYDFDEKHLLNRLTYLICYNEETFNRFENFYREKTRQSEFNLVDLYKDNLSILANEIIQRKYKNFILEKLTPVQISAMIKSFYNDETILCSLLESSDAKEGLSYLLKAPEELNHYFSDKPVLFSYLNYESFLLLENNINIWCENTEKINGVDFILNNKDLNHDATNYLLNKYTKEILERYERLERNSYENIMDYCRKKLLNDSLSEVLTDSGKKKSHIKI